MKREPLTTLFEDDSPRRGAPAWMVTYGDVMSLLLCFFVMLLAFSTMERERFKVVSGYIRDAFGTETERRATAPLSGATLFENPPAMTTRAKAQIFEQAKAALRGLPPEWGTEVTLEERGVRLRIDNGPLFRSGSAELEPVAGAPLARIADLIRSSGAWATVEGHSDNLPIRSATFPSNWELSAARAGAVVRFLVARGLAPVRLEAVGRADTRPLGDNATDEGRQRNRRVEILLRTGS
ncbi:MAG: OmpA family protein [Acidobacteria bacterium]|jgi:chemotaxis protein MotB|nr:OmpA family protein [Acidobacteriota bacterium]